MRQAICLATLLLWASASPATKEGAVGGAVGMGLLGVSDLPDKSAIEPVGLARYLLRLPSEPSPGFAVSGDLRHALDLSWIGIRKHQSPYGDFSGIPAGGTVYAVFFSYASAYQVELLSVSRRDSKVSIGYRFVPTFAPKVHYSLALIPLGALPPGVYEVDVEQEAMEQKYLDAGFRPVSSEDAARLVSGSFEFIVDPPPGPDPASAKDARVIPAAEFIGNGPHGLRELEPEVFVLQFSPERVAELAEPESLETIRRRAKASKVYQIENGLARFSSPKDGSTRPGFAVGGADRQAILAETHRVIVGEQEPHQEFLTNDEITIVFFQYARGNLARPRSAEISGRSIRILYSLTASRSSTAISRVVLIPCGTLDPGTYEVHFEPISEATSDGGGLLAAPLVGKEDNHVSRSFQLRVSEPDALEKTK